MPTANEIVKELRSKRESLSGGGIIISRELRDAAISLIEYRERVVAPASLADIIRTCESNGWTNWLPALRSAAESALAQQDTREPSKENPNV